MKYTVSVSSEEIIMKKKIYIATETATPEYGRNHSFDEETLAVTFDYREACRVGEMQTAHLTASEQKRWQVVVTRHDVDIYGDEADLSARELYDRIMGDCDDRFYSLVNAVTVKPIRPR